MFKKLFGKKTSADDQHAETSEQSISRTLDHAIEQHKAQDPFVGAKIGADELVQRLTDAMQDGKGVHAESLLATVASLAGFACVYGTLQQVRSRGMDTRAAGIVDVECNDGRKFYMGDHINFLLLEGPQSVWALSAGMAQHLGDTDLLDVTEVTGYVAGTLCGDTFGIPRLPDGHPTFDLPLNYVRDLWNVVLPHVDRRAPEPLERVVLFGLAIQKVMEMAKEVVAPSIALRIVMECAVPMAKIDPDTITG